METLKYETLLDLVGGERRVPRSLGDRVLRDPATGEEVSPMVVTPDDRLEQALQTAADVHHSGSWRQLSPEDRAMALEAVAASLESDLDTIARLESLSTGVVIRTTRRLTGILPVIFRRAAEITRRFGDGVSLPGEGGEVEVLRCARGPALCLAPWNSPAPIAAHKAASALGAGCPVILKPSEYTPFSAHWLASAAVRAGLPDGVLQLVYGGPQTGARLVRDPRIRAVSFTGGLSAGRAIGQVCAERMVPVQLELGGNNPFVVLEDAGPQQAADSLVTALTTLNGQWCRAPGRLILHESLGPAVLELTEAGLNRLRPGHPLDEEADYGPLVHGEHRRRLQDAVDRLTGPGTGMLRATAPLPEDGAWFAPALITGCSPEATLEEMFGPVAAVHGYRGEEEALRLANQTPYGLAAWVFAGDTVRARAFSREIEAGGVQINGVGITGLHPDAPRSAWGLSGIGDEGAAETWSFFTGCRVVGVHPD